MKVCDAISFRVSNIVQKKQFVKDILQSIAKSSGRALLVGGAVRDLFLQVPVQDLDFEVYGLSLDQLQEILAKYGVVSLVGKSFGVLRVHGLDVDWSLPRKDSSGRHPLVQYDPEMSYEQAFIRRDLTINAMGIEMQTMELIDPYGGLHDLESQILKAPDLDFFAQDPLRLLRVMQFCARFDMRVDEDLSHLCAGMDMSKVSCERIEQEFYKLFIQAARPSLGLRWLVTIGKFQELLPGVRPDENLWNKIDQAAQLHYATDQDKVAVMWAVLVSWIDCKQDDRLHKIENQEQQPILQFMRRMSRHELLAKQVSLLVLYAPCLSLGMTDADVKWIAHWLQPVTCLRLLLQFFAIRYDAQVAKILYARADQLGVLDGALPSLLTGKDFLEIVQGQQLGELVKKAYQLQLDVNIVDKDVLKQQAIKNLKNS